MGKEVEIEKIAKEIEEELKNENWEERRIFCPKCGTPSEKGMRFCGTCGTNLEEIVTEVLQTPQSLPARTTTQQPAQIVYVYEQQPKKQQITVLGIIGMVIGILSLLIFSWVSYFSFLWMPFMYLAFSIIGIVLSAISVRENTAIGVTGLVTSILGGLVQIGWCIFAIILYILYYG